MAESNKQALENPGANQAHEATGTRQAGAAFEVIEALPGLFNLEKRSATLEGSVPLKAAQFCKPFIDGNAAGFYLWFSDTALIRKSPKGPVLGLTEEGHARATTDYGTVIERLVGRQFLAKDGYWYRQLRKGPYWTTRNKLHVWTGFLVRPSAGNWILVSDAYNRRSPIAVSEYVVPDDGAFIPLVLTWDLASTSQKDTFLEKEVACLTPLRPGVRFSVHTLAQAPEVGRAYCDYFGDRWNGSAPGKYLGAYRKLTAGESNVVVDKEAHCKLVIASGPNIHRICAFDRFATAAGWTRNHPAAPRLQYVVVRSIFDVKGRWDGHALRDLTAETPHAVQRLRSTWTSLYGKQSVASLDRLLVDYAKSTHGPRIGEPYLAMTPWVFAVSPPGWSSIIDGCHRENVDGLRAVISTDQYNTVFEVWQFVGPCRFTFARGSPLMRILPVPRRLLGETFKKVALDAS